MLPCTQARWGWTDSHPRSLLFPGSEPEQHCLFPAGQSVEGATKGWATGEFPCGGEEGYPEVVRYSKTGVGRGPQGRPSKAVTVEVLTPYC